MTNNTSNKDMRELREELHQLTELVQKNMKHAASHGSNVLGFSRSDIRDFAHRAGETVRHYVDNTSKHAGEIRDKAKDRITTQPFRSVAAAVAGGLLLGAILRRK